MSLPEMSSARSVALSGSADPARCTCARSLFPASACTAHESTVRRDRSTREARTSVLNVIGALESLSSRLYVISSRSKRPTNATSWAPLRRTFKSASSAPPRIDARA